MLPALKVGEGLAVRLLRLICWPYCSVFVSCRMVSLLPLCFPPNAKFINEKVEPPLMAMLSMGALTNKAAAL